MWIVVLLEWLQTLWELGPGWWKQTTHWEPRPWYLFQGLASCYISISVRSQQTTSHSCFHNHEWLLATCCPHPNCESHSRTMSQNKTFLFWAASCQIFSHSSVKIMVQSLFSKVYIYLSYHNAETNSREKSKNSVVDYQSWCIAYFVQLIPHQATKLYWPTMVTFVHMLLIEKKKHIILAVFPKENTKESFRCFFFYFCSFIGW